MNNHEASDYPRLLSRAVTYLHRHKVAYMNQQLKPYNLQGCMYMIMHFVSRNPGTSQDAMVTNMNIDKCTIARRTKKLCEMGYIRRETDAMDRRQNNLYLTEEGEKVIPAIRNNFREWNESICKNLNDDERATLVALLEKVVDTCDEENK